MFFGFNRIVLSRLSTNYNGKICRASTIDAVWFTFARMSSEPNDPVVDTTGAPLMPIAEGGEPSPRSDPALAITVALANELQQVYANDPAKLQAANRTLRKSIN